MWERQRPRVWWAPSSGVLEELLGCGPANGRVVRVGDQVVLYGLPEDAIELVPVGPQPASGSVTASMRCGKCSELVSGEYGADELKCSCGACVISLKPRPHPLDVAEDK